MRTFGLCLGFLVSAAAAGQAMAAAPKPPPIAIQIIFSSYYTAAHSNDTTPLSKKACDGKVACSLIASNGAQGGDPDFGTRKKFKVEYYCAKDGGFPVGDKGTAEADENEAVGLLCTSAGPRNRVILLKRHRSHR